MDAGGGGGGQGAMPEFHERRAAGIASLGFGKDFVGLCPFHQEKSPSFKVENERRLYKCFGCGKGGDAFKWLTETEGLSFPEAVEKLAGEAGVP